MWFVPALLLLLAGRREGADSGVQLCAAEEMRARGWGERCLPAETRAEGLILPGWGRRRGELRWELGAEGGSSDPYPRPKLSAGPRRRPAPIVLPRTERDAPRSQ